MAEIRCLTFGLIEANTYTTPKGNSYLFQIGGPTRINDKEDIEFFLRCGGGALFEEVKPIKKIIERVKETITGKGAEKKLSEGEIEDMSKEDQEKIIRKLGGINYRIPKYKSDRVKLIIKLQG